MSDHSAESPAAPTSLGWLAAHALEGADATPWRSAAFARAASEGMRMLAPARPDADPAWNGFSKPFREIVEHVASIQDPLRTAVKPTLAGIGEGAGAALRDLAAPKAPVPMPLSGIGRSFGEAMQAGDSPFRRKPASWVETGNPSVRRAGARPPVAPTKPSASAKPAPAPETSNRKPKPAPPAPDLAPLSHASLPPAQTALEAWAEKLDRKMRQAREREEAAQVSAAKRPAAPVPPKRVPFKYPEDPADPARFKEILSRHAPTGSAPPPGPPGAFAPKPGPAAPSDTVTPVAPPWPGVPGPADPGFGEILSRLPAPGPRPSGPEPTDVFTPAQPPIPGRGHVPAPPISAPPVPTAAQPTQPAPAALAGSAKPSPSEIEWLEEEDDLAARLHSLLRRQARRRGVDLS